MTMKRWGARRGLCGLLATWAILTSHGASAEMAPVPRALAEPVRQAETLLGGDRTDEAVDVLRRADADVDEDHPLLHLLLGHAYLRREDLDASAAEYRKALEMNEALDSARQGLARIHALRGEWPSAVKQLAAFVEPERTSSDWLGLYAKAALETGDTRLARVLTDAGMVRFPHALSFRRMDAALLAADGEPAQLKAAVLRLLRADPDDPALWERLALAASRRAEDEPAGAAPLPALEAAMLSAPGDLGRQRRFLAALLQAGDWMTVLEHGEALLAGRFRQDVLSEVPTMELLIRAADMGRRDEVLRRWLGQVDEKKRSKTLHLAAARLALREGKKGPAREALRRLIEAGEADASIFLWAGHLAETEGLADEAQAYYEQARAQGGEASRAAALYLARLHIDRRAYTQARLVLSEYLREHPEDPYARSMLLLSQSASETPAAEGGAGRGE